MAKLKINPKDHSRKDGVERCPRCYNNKWKTIQKDLAWKCRWCGLIRYVKPLGEK